MQTLETLLRLAHPIMPFITEEIWQKVAPAGRAPKATPSCWRPTPSPTPRADDPDAVAEMEWVQQFILGVRRIKGEMNIPPGKPLPVLVANASDAGPRAGSIARPYLDFLARTESVTVLDDEADAPESAIALVGKMKLLIPMAGLIDKDAELGSTGQGDRQPDAPTSNAPSKKLANPSFVDKAPAAVVQKERDRLNDQGAALADLVAQQTRISAL